MSDYHTASTDTGLHTKPKRLTRGALLLRQVLGTILVSFLLLSTLYYLYEPTYSKTPGSSRPETGDGSDNRRDSLSLAELRKGIYQPRFEQIDWLPDSQDGEYIGRNSEGGYVLSRWAQDNSTHIVGRRAHLGGEDRNVRSVTLNKERTKALVKTDVAKHWRHSTFALFWILDIQTQSSVAVKADNTDALLSLAEWSPAGDKIAFVAASNVYIHDVASGKVTRVTHDGGPNVFNGIPDWVYEEEVFGNSKALWWSENGSSVAYLRSNNTNVPIYPLTFFVSGGGLEPDAYPKVTNLKYPKPGFQNPEVDLWLYDVEAGEATELSIQEPKEKLITEVFWAGSDKLIAKIMSRDSDIYKYALVDAADKSVRYVRELDGGKTGSWFEISHNTQYVPADPDNGRPEPGYVDLIDHEGYNHLGYFTPLDAKHPVLLTSGSWEVVDTAYQVNLETNKVYFSATKRSSIEQHIYEVPLTSRSPAAQIKAVSPDEDGVYSASYSADGTYAVITYQGPNVPWQKVIKTGESLADAEFLEANEELQKVVKSKKLGDVIYGQIEVTDNVSVNYREIRPANFDPTREHPILFYNYGGPGSQQVSRRFALDYQRIYAESHNAIVVTVDPRGTGFRGREFRAVVRDHLGRYEAHDVIAVAQRFNDKAYVDANSTAIWGWSYGGFLTLKTLETDAGNTFRYGVAVAPVTDWRFYDSVYTERYMHTPQENPDGYKEAAVSDAEALGKARRFFVMHGTGDDNVHLQNTLSLVDKLDLAGVENYDLLVFPDSDHSIYFHSANPIVYDRLDSWLRKHQSKLPERQ